MVRRTGIKLLPTIGQCATVVHGDEVTLLGLALALDGLCDLDLELFCGHQANGGRSENGKECDCLHGADQSVTMGNVVGGWVLKRGMDRCTFQVYPRWWGLNWTGGHLTYSSLARQVHPFNIADSAWLC